MSKVRQRDVKYIDFDTGGLGFFGKYTQLYWARKTKRKRKKKTEGKQREKKTAVSLSMRDNVNFDGIKLLPVILLQLLIDINLTVIQDG